MPIAVPQTRSTPAVGLGTVVGFLVFVELTSGFIQGFYLPLFGAIATHLQVSDADITWFNTVQALAAGVCVPVLAKLGDIFGHRRVLRLAVLSVLLGTILTAVSPNYGLVLFGRALIGPLAVWLPLEVALVHNRLAGGTARRAIGMLVSALTLGVVGGTLASGGLATALPNLTTVLLVPALITAACAVIVVTKVPESTVRTNPRIDIVGFLGLAVFMITLLWGLRAAQTAGFAASATMLPLAVATVVLAAWIVWEYRAEVPAVNIRLLSSRMLWPAYATSFLFGMVLFGSQTILTTFLAAKSSAVGYGFFLQPGSISLITALNALLAAVGATFFAFMAKSIGMRGVLVLGAVLGAFGNVTLLFFSADFGLVVVSVALSGLGGGLLLGALPALVSEVSPRDQTGIATGIYNSLKTLGGSAAGAIFGVVLAASVRTGGTTSSLGGYRAVWTICLGAFLICPILLAFLRKSRSHTESDPAPTEGLFPEKGPSPITLPTE